MKETEMSFILRKSNIMINILEMSNMIKIIIISFIIAWLCYNGNAKEFVKHVGVAMWAHVVASLIINM